ncbi:hypothetical protein MKY30_07960 [Oceanobacillus sp. FSL W8-0428]|nr:MULTISPECIES: hypothetical protein [Bacillaceae]MCO4220038.1 hypothetical protein [Bacillus sp. 10017]HDR7337412.1 hypothetical protein [Bacillus anthracis]EEK69674.1 hypothetical protein bcere0006_1510 [Bacillus wiedmannii]KKZ89868.1 hypothetical protein B4086_0186 [Bacillus cereus]KLA13582.1 hypothetical protein B4087_5836 [Bacillus cereus]
MIYHNLLNENQKESVNQLFEVSEGSTNSPWNQLKEDAKRATLSHLELSLLAEIG